MTPPIPFKTVVGQYVGPDGAPVSGKLRFTPSTTIYDSAGNIAVAPFPIFVTLDGTGAFSVQLEVTDNPTTTPTGWVWQMSELIPNGSEVTFQIPSTAPSTVGLGYLAPQTFTVPQYSYMTTAAGAALDARVTHIEDVASIITTATVDASAGTGSLRTLGTGATQAAAGNHTHAVAAITGLDSYLEPWLRPGASVDAAAQGGGTPVTCPVGTTTVVAKPSSGRRVIKTIRVAAPTAGTAVTLTLNGVNVFTRAFTNDAGSHPPLDVTWPVSASDTTGLQAVVTGATAYVTPVYGDRTDALVDRFALTSSSATGPTSLVAAGTARTFSHLWVANLATAATATCQVRVDTGPVAVLTLGPGDYYSDESWLPVTSAQALRFVGDGTNALTYVVSGR